MVIAAAYVAGAAAATRPLDVLDLDTVDRFHRVPESGGPRGGKSVRVGGPPAPR